MQRELKEAIEADDLPRVRVLVGAGASIGRQEIAGQRGNCTAMHYAWFCGRTSIFEWLLAEGGASLSEVREGNINVLLDTMTLRKFGTMLWLFEHGGADITDTTSDGFTMWDLFAQVPACYEDEEFDTVGDLAAFLRFMVLQRAPPADFVMLKPSLQHIVEEGARLRTRLPAYIAQRRALLAKHTPLIAPLRALVSGYEEPTTTEELWATGLGALVP